MAADSNGMMGSMMQDLAFAIPGVDEAMSFAEIMKLAPLQLTWGNRIDSRFQGTLNPWNIQ